VIASVTAGHDGRAPCPLCLPVDEDVLWRDDRCRVILVPDPDYSGYCRVIWHAHVAEMTDLSASDRAHIMDIVLTVERAQRETLQPTKINLASLGNQVPHLHWHVIARFVDDAHFPDAIWAQRRRNGRPGDRSAIRASLLDRLRTLLR
jgi:diadenosine tetraphosphate (Ap4A) HIT family hydrolase